MTFNLPVNIENGNESYRRSEPCGSQPTVNEYPQGTEINRTINVIELLSIASFDSEIAGKLP
jgi:hypothetical protein